MTASVLNVGLTANRAEIRLGYGAGSSTAVATVERMDSRTNNPSRPLSEREAADRLGLSPRTLQDWRRRACGPVFLKLGKRVAYHPHDLDAFEAQCRVQPKGTQEGT